MTSDFSHQDWRDRSFRGQDLRQISFEAADVRGCDFRGAQLVGTTFKNAKLGRTGRQMMIVAITVTVLVLLAFHAFSQMFFGGLGTIRDDPAWGYVLALQISLALAGGMTGFQANIQRLRQASRLSASTISGSTISGSTVSASTISGSTVSASTISTPTISGSTVSASTVSGPTLPPSTVSAQPSATASSRLGLATAMVGTMASCALMGFFYGGDLSGNNPKIAIASAVGLGIAGVVIGKGMGPRWLTAGLTLVGAIAAYGFFLTAGTNASALFHGKIYGLCMVWLGISALYLKLTLDALTFASQRIHAAMSTCFDPF